MSNGANNRVLTATGTDAINAEANLTFDGSTLNVVGDVSGSSTSTGSFGNLRIAGNSAFGDLSFDTFPYNSNSNSGQFITLKAQDTSDKAILELAYRCALRVSEVCNLKIEHIDSGRMMILISDSKGNKDRYCPMSERLLKTLRLYFREYKPVEYLFNGQFSIKYSHGSCQKIFKKYIDLNKSFHSLRHSGATTMLNNGTNLRVIQNILGHKSSRTSEIYTHVSSDLILHAAI